MTETELEREMERFAQFRLDTCAARRPVIKPERQEGVLHADVQTCLSCGKWSRIGESFDCPFGWDDDVEVVERWEPIQPIRGGPV